jgi:hypothetical protein
MGSFFRFLTLLTFKSKFPLDIRYPALNLDGYLVQSVSGTSLVPPSNTGMPRQAEKNYLFSVHVTTREGEVAVQNC